MCTNAAFRCVRTHFSNLLSPLQLGFDSRLTRAVRGIRRWTGATALFCLPDRHRGGRLMCTGVPSPGGVAPVPSIPGGKALGAPERVAVARTSRDPTRQGVRCVGGHAKVQESGRRKCQASGAWARGDPGLTRPFTATKGQGHPFRSGGKNGGKSVAVNFVTLLW